MIMGMPLFFLFAIYATVNTYFPILYARLGYSPTLIGLLQGIFEASGLLVPIFISSRVDRGGKYGKALVLMGLLMLVMLPALALARSFWVTSLVIAIFAVGFKGVVPVADALVSRILDGNRIAYGKVRALGTVGFVSMALLLQFTHLVNTDEPSSIALWTGIPAILFSLSVFFLPGLMTTRLHESHVPTLPSFRDSLSSFPRSFWIGLSLIFLGFLGMVPSQRFFSLYVSEYLKLDFSAGLWALSALAEVPFMFLSGKFIKRFGNRPILLAGLGAIAIRNLIYAIFPSLGGAVAGQLLHSVCFGLFHPAAVLFVMERSPARLMAVALTLYTSVAVGAASVLGSISGGIIIDLAGYRALFALFALFPVVGMILYSRFGNLLRHQD